MPNDVTAVLDKFSNLPCAPIKARCDLVGIPPMNSLVEQKITILDVTAVSDAFSGIPYPYPPVTPCPP